MSNKVFCIKCAKHTEYDIKSRLAHMKVRNIEFDYIEKSAICKECGNYLYIAKINDSNISSRLEAYKKEAIRNPDY